MRILTVIGARPQIIKSSILSRALIQESIIEEFVVHTGQHYNYDMSGIFFDQLQISPPFRNLNIQNRSNVSSTAEIIAALDVVIGEIKPSLTIVFGDTNSTLAGALASVKNKIPLAHIEAGLRSFDFFMQEEINRVVTDSVSSLAFCPGSTSFNFLNSEVSSYPKRKIFNSGDILLDSLLCFAPILQQHPLDIKVPSQFILATIHRAENVDDPRILKGIIEGLNEIHSYLPVVVPLHPRTRIQIELAQLKTAFFELPPLGYLEVLKLIIKSEFVITDSGGLQREAYYLQKPSIVVRDSTEWVELINNNYSVLSSPTRIGLLTAYEKIKNQKIIINKGLYGVGNAATVIQQHILDYLQ